MKLHDIDYFKYGKIENKKFWKRLGSKPDFKNKKVLDFGCGVGHLLEHIKSKNLNVKYTGVDTNKQSIELAKAGVDIIAPSDMMDGRVQLIRKKLDTNGFVDLPIFPYSVKYASSFYGPFREAVDSSPKKGDRKSYQMNFKNSNEFIREIEQDLIEGADAIIIKPALSYLDIISRAKNKFNVPIIAYNVSGEYSMVKAGNEKKYIEEEHVMMEIMYSIKRAGADAIITYHALEIANALKKDHV